MVVMFDLIYYYLFLAPYHRRWIEDFVLAVLLVCYMATGGLSEARSWVVKASPCELSVC